MQISNIGSYLNKSNVCDALKMHFVKGTPIIDLQVMASLHFYMRPHYVHLLPVTRFLI